jgi:hypothetical protein
MEILFRTSLGRQDELESSEREKVREKNLRLNELFVRQEALFLILSSKTCIIFFFCVLK